MISMQGKKVLITGGAGFLGSNLARHLISKGAEVSILVRPEVDKWRIKDIEDQIRIIEGDLTDAEFVNKIIPDNDFLFHLAWQTDLKKSMAQPMKDLKKDLVGLLNILEAAKELNKNLKIVFTSTVTVIGDAPKLPSNENEKENPISIYDVHKLTAEKYLQVYCKQHGVKTCVLRLSNVFGEWQRTDNPNRGVLNFMIGRALRGETLMVYGKGDFIRDYSYVGDYVNAFISAALSDKTNGEVYVLGSGVGKTFKEVVEKIHEIIDGKYNKEVRIDFVPFPEEEHKINRRDFVADISKFKEATGWQPNFNFEEALEKTIEFYAKRE